MIDIFGMSSSIDVSIFSAGNKFISFRTSQTIDMQREEASAVGAEAPAVEDAEAKAEDEQAEDIAGNQHPVVLEKPESEQKRKYSKGSPQFHAL